MAEYKFSELVNIDSLIKMAENLYEAAGIPIGIIDKDGVICVKTGWQDICTKFHRENKESCLRCMQSDNFISCNLTKDKYIEHRCLNNMWDIGVPIIIGEEQLATLYLGQFFYDDEIIDIEFFRNQAKKYGFNQEEYINSLYKVPRFTRKKVKLMIDYYLGLVSTLAESGLRQLEYKKTQKQLANKQKYFNSIVNSVNEAIFIYDINGKILDVNETAINKFGYSRDELMDMDVLDLLSEKSVANKERLLEILNNASMGNQSMLELLCSTKNNSELWVEINFSSIELDDSKELIITVRDITERKKCQLALQKEAEEMEILRSEFFANISHELKTPLNIIFGTLQINELEFNNKDKPIDREKLLNNINIEKQNCFRLLRLMNNLIDATKLEAGYVDKNMVNCNIINVVEEITLSVAEYIHINDISLIFDTEIEEKTLACDLDKIERIMLNLLSNAVKFTPAGGKIFVNMIDDGEYIKIIVQDTGIGIPTEKLNIIFDRFRQVDKSLTRNYEGSGIGLSLVKSLVEMHNGEISVESEYGVGTKFIVKLPVIVIKDKSEKDDLLNVELTRSNCVERIKIEFSDIYK